MKFSATFHLVCILAWYS